MQPQGLEQVLVHGWELAFKLHRPHSLMQCTWRSTEGTGMSSGAMTYYYCISQTNRRQAQSTAKPPNLYLLFYLISYLSVSYSLKFEPWYEAMFSYELQQWKLQNVFALNNSRVTVCYLVSPFTNTGVAGGMIWQAWSKIKDNNIPLRGVSLTFIDQTDPLALPLPTFAVAEWFCRKQNASYLTFCPHVLPFGDRGPEMHENVWASGSSPYAA